MVNNRVCGFLARLQSNSGLWIDDVRRSVCMSVNIMVNLCVKFWNPAMPSSVVSCIIIVWLSNTRIYNYTPRNEVRGGILESPCPSIGLSVCLSVRLSDRKTRARLGKIARLGIGCRGGYFVPLGQPHSSCYCRTNTCTCIWHQQELHVEYPQSLTSSGVDAHTGWMVSWVVSSWTANHEVVDTDTCSITDYFTMYVGGGRGGGLTSARSRPQATLVVSPWYKYNAAEILLIIDSWLTVTNRSVASNRIKGFKLLKTLIEYVRSIRKITFILGRNMPPYLWYYVHVARRKIHHRHDATLLAYSVTYNMHNRI